MTDAPVASGKSSFDLIDASRLFDLLDLSEDTVVLDAACGVGRYTIALAKRMGPRGRIYAVDLWEQGIEVLNAALAREGISIVQTIVADITKTIPREDASIDICLMATVLHDLSPAGRQGAVREAARLLRPRGELAVIEFFKTSEGPGPPAAIRLSEKELEELVAPNGFALRSCDDLGQFAYLSIFRRQDR